MFAVGLVAFVVSILNLILSDPWKTKKMDYVWGAGVMMGFSLCMTSIAIVLWEHMP